MMLGLFGSQQDTFDENHPLTQRMLLNDRREAFRRANEARGGQASPGQAGLKMQGIVIDKLSALAALGDKQNEQASNIWERLGTGNMTYAEANKKLTQLLTKTDTQTTTIREQKTEVNLNPLIEISAAQTGNAVTLAATGSRIVIR